MAILLLFTHIWPITVHEITLLLTGMGEDSPPMVLCYCNNLACFAGERRKQIVVSGWETKEREREGKNRRVEDVWSVGAFILRSFETSHLSLHKMDTEPAVEQISSVLAPLFLSPYYFFVFTVFLLLNLSIIYTLGVILCSSYFRLLSIYHYKISTVSDIIV